MTDKTHLSKKYGATVLLFLIIFIASFQAISDDINLKISNDINSEIKKQKYEEQKSVKKKEDRPKSNVYTDAKVVRVNNSDDSKNLEADTFGNIYLKNVVIKGKVINQAAGENQFNIEVGVGSEANIGTVNIE